MSAGQPFPVTIISSPFTSADTADRQAMMIDAISRRQQRPRLIMIATEDARLTIT